jgi:hypothetical protein
MYNKYGLGGYAERLNAKLLLDGIGCLDVIMVFPLESIMLKVVLRVNPVS